MSKLTDIELGFLMATENTGIDAHQLSVTRFEPLSVVISNPLSVVMSFEETNADLLDWVDELWNGFPPLSEQPFNNDRPPRAIV
jgi:hypothetical protein